MGKTYKSYPFYRNPNRYKTPQIALKYGRAEYYGVLREEYNWEEINLNFADGNGLERFHLQSRQELGNAGFENTIQNRISRGYR